MIVGIGQHDALRMLNCGNHVRDRTPNLRRGRRQEKVRAPNDFESARPTGHEGRHLRTLQSIDPRHQDLLDQSSQGGIRGKKVRFAGDRMSRLFAGLGGRSPDIMR